ncbi:PAS domain-containing protein [Rhodovulum sp. MB263]|uniref:PAS domain-containing protein n=1 Tax=Rhodovulum sp. (strain MB263) TaxID=308754 RepID=UPI0018C896F8|nr:PAS domain-containing protein [Rhodovulum sp. MB263]
MEPTSEDQPRTCPDTAPERAFLEGIAAVLGCDRVALLCPDPAAGGRLRVTASTPTGLEGRSFPAEWGLLGPWRQDDLQQSSGSTGTAPLLPDISSLVLVRPCPSGSRDIALLGIDPRPGLFTDAQIPFLEHTARALAHTLPAHPDARGTLPRARPGVRPDMPTDTAPAPAREGRAPGQKTGRPPDGAERAATESGESATAGIVAAIGRQFDAARCVLWQHCDGTFRPVLVWSSPDRPPGAAQIPTDTDAETASILARRIADFAAMQPIALGKQTALGRLGIGARLMLPFRDGTELGGVLCIDRATGQRPFDRRDIATLSCLTGAAGLLHQQETRRLAEAERSLLEAERNRMRAVFELLPDTVIELDADRRYTHIHSHSRGSARDRIDGLISFRPEECLAPATAEAIHALLDRAEAAGFAVLPEMVHRPAPAAEPEIYSLSAMVHAPSPEPARYGYVLVIRDVTAESTQRRERNRLGRIVEHMSREVFLTDRSHRLTWANRATEDRVGQPAAGLLGLSPQQAFEALWADAAGLGRICERLSSEGGFAGETGFLDQGGNRVWFDIAVMPLCDATGGLEGWMWLLSDITERHRDKDRLALIAQKAREAEERVVQAIETLPDAFAFFDSEDRLILFNERYRQDYPRSAPAIEVGQTFEAILRYGLAHGEFPIALQSGEAMLAERLSRHRRPYDESEQQLADGRWLRVIERRTPDGGHIELCSDITELKQLAQRAQADWLAAMDGSRDGIAIAGPDGGFLYMNPAHRDMFWLDATDGRDERSWIELYSGEAPERMNATVLPALEAQGHWSGEVWHRCPDGSRALHELSLTRRHAGGILCIARDLSERVRANRELARLRDDLQVARQRELIGHLSIGLAHDFNNLLAAISGSASLIADSGIVEANVRRIQLAVGQASGLLRRLADFGMRPPLRERLDIRVPVRAAADLLLADGSGAVELQLDLPVQPVMVDAVQTDIMQVALNLLIGARDSILSEQHPDGRGRIRIGLCIATAAELKRPLAFGSLDPARAYCLLEVENDGPGLDAAARNSVFAKCIFSRSTVDCGLGLAIVPSIVGKNGGAISLADGRGPGACFSVFWPLESYRDAPLTAPRAPRPRQLSGRLDGHMVLVIDDNPDVLRVISGILETAGAEVATCTMAEDALEAVCEDPRHWDLLVTDYAMPAMSGAQLAQEVHAHVPDLPVLLMTAHTDWRGHGEGHSRDEFAAILGKPISSADLLAAAEAAILDR